MYLAYPPADPESGSWTIYMDPDNVCTVVVYEGSFSWNDLVGCTSADGSLSYVTAEQTDDAITLSGTFYINVVSPYEYSADFGYYRVYQVLSQPFVITVNRNVYVLDSTGINVLTISIIAVYKEDGASVFKLVILTEAQEYLQLARSDNGLVLFASSSGESAANTIQTSEFTVATTAESSDSSPLDGCLDNKAFICSQLWEIEAPGDCSSAQQKYVDFSGDYTLAFTPVCRDETVLGSELVTYCESWLEQHSSIAQGVQLTATLTWMDEECDPLLYEVQFEAEMSFYTDDAFSVEAGDDQLYQVGEDRIYVQVVTGFPLATYNVFDTTLLNVWICTFDPLTPPAAIDATDPDSWATAGCFSAARDGVALGDDNPYEYHVYSTTSTTASTNDFLLVNDPTGHPDTSDASRNVLQFSFVVPPKIARDKLYIHAQVEVSLQSENGRRRRLLKSSRATANQMSHFIDDIGVTAEKKKKHDDNYLDNEPQPQPQQPYQYQPYQQPVPQAPVTPNADYVLSLQSPWILAIGGVLAVVLTLNIVFMCYMNCCNDSNNGLRGGRVSFSRARRSGYNSVKVNESGVDDDSEVRAINAVASE